MAPVDRAQVERWVAGYEQAWRTSGTDALRSLFTDDVTYLPSPWAAPVAGLPALAAWWDGERDGPEEDFTMAHEVVAIDDHTAVVRVSVGYHDADTSRWRDLWVLRFASDGRCQSFEEWPFSPDQPDGHD